jgi:hypothetical protein
MWISNPWWESWASSGEGQWDGMLAKQRRRDASPTLGGNTYLCLVVIPECWFIVLHKV